MPARLDRLPWSRFHWLVVVALGITWILDGLEVTLAGSVAGALRDDASLGLSASDVGLANSAYLAGAVGGALFFGWLTDRLGRKRMFSMTLGLYLLATAATAFAWDLPSYAAMRFLTGAGIGGEYSAINSAIQELIPARRRGWTDLAINGSFWVGAAMASALSIVLLDPLLFSPDFGWRLAFFGGALIGLVILWLRRFLPESPRWLAIHGRYGEADSIVTALEKRIAAEGHEIPPVSERPVSVRPRRSTSLVEVAVTLFRTYPRRTVYGLSLMIAQAFFYNAIFFTYAMMLTDFYAGPAPMSAGTFCRLQPETCLDPASGPFFRHCGTTADDRADLWPLSRPAHGERAGIPLGTARRLHPDPLLERNLLLRFRRGFGGLSHGCRELPSGNAGFGDRHLLCAGNGHWRCRRALAVRDTDRERIARSGAARLHDRLRVDGCGGDIGAFDRHRQRAQTAGASGQAAFLGLTATGVTFGLGRRYGSRPLSNPVHLPLSFAVIARKPELSDPLCKRGIA
ncbi:MAG: MFS transporter [Novosphingobium sp.]